MKFASIVSMCMIVSFGVVRPEPAAIANEAELIISAENPAADVKATIKKMIVLIDERKTLEILENYTDVPAEDRKKIAEQIDQDKLDELKKYLGMAEKLEPKVSDDGKSVVFESDDFPRPMRFVKSGDRWIMKDKK